MTVAFLSGHFSKGIFFYALILVVGFNKIDPAGIFPFVETINIVRVILIKRLILLLAHIIHL
jgi:hypothetical protein